LQHCSNCGKRKGLLDHQGRCLYSIETPTTQPSSAPIAQRPPSSSPPGKCEMRRTGAVVPSTLHACMHACLACSLDVCAAVWWGTRACSQVRGDRAEEGMQARRLGALLLLMPGCGARCCCACAHRGSWAHACTPTHAHHHPCTHTRIRTRNCVRERVHGLGGGKQAHHFGRCVHWMHGCMGVGASVHAHYAGDPVPAPCRRTTAALHAHRGPSEHGATTVLIREASWHAPPYARMQARALPVAPAQGAASLSRSPTQGACPCLQARPLTPACLAVRRRACSPCARTSLGRVVCACLLNTKHRCACVEALREAGLSCSCRLLQRRTQAQEPLPLPLLHACIATPDGARRSMAPPACTTSIQPGSIPCPNHA